MSSGEAFVVRNDVPFLERGLAWFFVLVGAPIVVLVWRSPWEIPGWAVPLFGAVWPALVIGFLVRAYRDRRRVIVRFGARPPEVVVEERKLFRKSETSCILLSASLDVGEDSEGDPYGRLTAQFDDGSRLTIAEGHHLERLRSDHARVEAWLGGSSDQ